MYIIIVGAGDIGSFLVESATNDEHEVVVIEQDSERANSVNSSYECEVIVDDAISKKTLQEAGNGQADAIITTTSQDEINVMVCILAQETGIGKTASVINDPENRNLFEYIGVEILVDGYGKTAEHLYTALRYPSVVDRHQLGESKEIVKLQVGDHAPIAGHTISEVITQGYLRNDVMVIAIEQNETGDEPIVPKGDTHINTGDQVTIYSPSGTLAQIAGVFE